MLAIFITHFWHYFFWGGPIPQPVNVWYERAVWGNVVAVLPMAVLGAGGFTYHHFALKRMHESHDRHLKRILDALDPETSSETQIDRIADLVDDQKPGGVTVVLEELRKRNS